MQIGFVGLGKMGGNMVHRIRRDSDNAVVAFDFSADAPKAAESHGDELMQAYAEGFELPQKSEYGLDAERIANLWGQGSVVRSWLAELAARALAADGNDLRTLEGYVEDSGEGRWTLESGIDQDVPMPALTAALFARSSSRGNGGYSARRLAALRNQFGGHAVKAASGQ